MMRKNNNKIVLVLTLFAMVGIAVTANARPYSKSGKRTSQRTGQLKSTASCKPAEGAIDLDINNVRARLMTGGDMWWDIGTAEARYEVPKGTRKNALFAGSVWIGGLDAQGQLKVAAQTYRQDGNDYWPGPLDPNTAEIDASDCSEWDRFWKVNREDITKFRELQDKSAVESDPDLEAIYQWPAKGNTAAVGRNQNPLNIDATKDYAPFVDVNNDGEYHAVDGDYPDINGDQFIWWVFNDKGNVKQQSNTEGIGVEVQASAFAYSTKDYLNDATFYNYRLVNRGSLRLDSTYIATWTDADLGYYRDDYIGCDTTRGLGILYNGSSVDGQGQVNSYGSEIPMVGVDFFKGPIKRYDSAGVTVEEQLNMEAFTYYNNDFSVIGNPSNGIEIYYYMTGSITNGQRFSNDFKGPNTNSRGFGDGPTTSYVFYGDPGNPTEWSECTCNNPVGDRRFVHSSGPFTLEPGVVNDITIGAVWVSDVGGCPNTNFKKIRVADDQAQALFDNNFETIEGPEAPRLVSREMDRKLIFYLVNDPNSTNYKELYGRDTAERYRVSSIKAAQYVGHPDSLYKFEGYRVFQLKDRDVTPAQIFDDNGEVNTELAAEVFQCDIQNGISRIVNWDKRTDINDSTYVPVVKVTGADSGIRHSFEVTIDQFATGDDKRIVNYRNYYFVAVAYAYNNFAEFIPSKADSTQDIVYLESSKAAGGANIEVVAAMPNPANGDMGTVVNSDYGSGVIIKRLEGRGNGGHLLQLSDSSEDQAIYGVDDVSNPNTKIHQAIYPTYKAGFGPVDVKVIDPLRVKPHDWELYISGAQNSDAARGLDSFRSSWRLVNATTGDVIYAEREEGLGVVNEQILEDYGLAVTINQVGRPGDDQINGNGLITSDITFTDPAKPWLVGVQDAESSDPRNWIRSGNNNVPNDTNLCTYSDVVRFDTVGQFYEQLLSNNSLTRGTWAPYALATGQSNRLCDIGVIYPGTASGITNIQSVDIVFTDDKSKWSKCIVIEMQGNTDLSEGNVPKFDIRSHQSWDKNGTDVNGRPVYSEVPGDTGYSWFPGYAINQETGERLNILFSEDSWLKSENGADMIWNPSSTVIASNGTSVTTAFGGKHYVYVLNSRYDSCQSFVDDYFRPGVIAKRLAYQNHMMYVGLPILNPSYEYKSLDNGIIPTDTRIKIRVTRPYDRYATNFNLPAGQDTSLDNNGYPLYSFTTKNLAPVPLGDNPNADRDELLSKINVVPNPYYGYVGYEQNRLDTRVRIINLPQRAIISIYSLDGALIRRLQKDNPNVSYVDWDIRNATGLPIASGMYLMHVEADGIGETVLRWFGAMRPIDITNF